MDSHHPEADGGSEDGGDSDPWDDDPGGSPACSDEDQDTAPAPAGSALVPVLDACAADEVQRYDESISTLDHMIQDARTLDNPGIVTHLQRAQADIRRNAQGARQADARVAAAMHQLEADRRATVLQRQREERLCRDIAKRRKKEEDELGKVANELRKEHQLLREREKAVVRKEVAAQSRMQEQEHVRQRTVVLRDLSKDYDCGVFGTGKANGVSAKHRGNRLDCLDRIKRACVPLPPDLEVNWDRFKVAIVWRAPMLCSEFSSAQPC